MRYRRSSPLSLEEALASDWLMGRKTIREHERDERMAEKLSEERGMGGYPAMDARRGRRMVGPSPTRGGA